tara:strand:+ start:763 stop:981 length:219 start_codon:yes stop_codon:yes gene_type:complete
MSKKKAYEILQYHIDKNGFDYADNFRCYKEESDDHENMIKYENSYACGCCGFFDTEVMIDGEKWHIGCNYGH